MYILYYGGLRLYNSYSPKWRWAAENFSRTFLPFKGPIAPKRNCCCSRFLKFSIPGFNSLVILKTQNYNSIYIFPDSYLLISVSSRDQKQSLNVINFKLNCVNNKMLESY